MTVTEALEKLKSYEQTSFALSHAMGLLYYDGVTVAPKGAAAVRSDTTGELSRIDYQLTTAPDTVEMLETLKRSGVILGTATCKALPVALPILKEQGLYRYFDVLGGATLDASIDDKPSVIRWALGQPALAGRRVLMVGDRADDLNGGVANGLDAAGVLYGYGSREELAACKPVLLAETCGQLTRYILDT